MKRRITNSFERENYDSDYYYFSTEHSSLCAYYNFIDKNNVSVEGTELLTILLMLATPIVNVIVLWVLRFKGGNRKGAITDLRVRLEKIESALKTRTSKS